MNVQKVLWFLDELEVPFEHVPAGGSHGGLDTDAFAAMNPHRKVPVLVDDGRAIWESHTILRFLGSTYGSARYWPDDPFQRSRSERWMDWSQTALQPDFLVGVFWGYYRTPAPQRDWTSIRERLTRCGKHFALLDKLLAQQPFICGDALGLGDIAIGTCLYRWYSLDLERADTPNVRAYYERLSERDAYRRRVMISFEDLRGRLDY